MSTVILQVLERDLPKLPRRVAGIMEELEDPTQIDRAALVSKIELCGNLSDAVLHIVNSGYLRHSRKARSLDDAILLVGLEATRHIILGIVIHALFPRSQVVESFDRGSFLRHCLGTGIAARQLCLESWLDATYDSYKLTTYGLVHDIGVLALERCLPVTLSRIFRMVAEERVPVLEAEVKVLGQFTHSAIGEWVCRHWNLPADIRNVVHYHHAPRKAALNKQEIMLMHIADVLSFNYYESLLKSAHKYGLDPEMVRSLGLSMDQVAKVEQELPERVERAMQLLAVESLQSVDLS